MAFDQIEPIGKQGDDVRTALICHTIATGSLKKKDGDAFALNDFLLDWSGERAAKAVSPETLMAKFDKYFSMLAAADSKENV